MEDVFCPSPWIELSTRTDGTYAACCEAQRFSYGIRTHSMFEHYNSEEMKALRLAMLNGNREAVLKTCSSCFLKEDQGAESRRVRMNRKPDKEGYREQVDATVAKTVAYGDGRADPDFFYRLDFKIFGNFCNLRCSMCHPSASSSLAEDLRHVGLHNQNKPALINAWNLLYDKQQKVFWEQLDQVLSKVRKIYFTGGEPLLNKLHFQVLDFAISHGYAKNITLSYSSNLTILPSYRGRSLFELFNEFQMVHLIVSLESTGIRNNYIRYGSLYSEIIANAEKVKQNCPNTYVNSATAVSLFNIYDLTDTLTVLDPIFHDKNLNLLHDPWFMRAYQLPSPLKEEVLARLIAAERPELDSVINWVKAPVDPAAFPEFRSYMGKLDLFRGVRLPDFLKEFRPYW